METYPQWATWVTVGTSTTGNYNTTSSSTIVWNHWTTISASSNAVTVMPGGLIPTLSDEERAAQRERIRVAQAEQERRERERVEQQEAAAQRARETLRFVLTRDELARYDADNVLEIVASDGQHYRIGQHGYAGNVYLLDDHGCQIAAYCCHPNMWVRDDDDRSVGRMPTEDAWIAQILALRHDADDFTRTANVSTRPCREQTPARLVA